MLGVKPYISFSGNCEEAVNFYKEALGAEVLTDAFARAGKPS